MKNKNAHWQQQYRERAVQEGMQKLQTWLDAEIADRLESICQRHEITKRAAIQQAIRQYDEQSSPGKPCQQPLHHD